MRTKKRKSKKVILRYKRLNYNELDEDLRCKMKVDFNKCFNNLNELSDVYKTYVIMREGKVVSFLQLDGNIIWNFCTPEKYRRKGYAKKLINYVKRRICELETSLNLYVDQLKENHDKLLNYYKKVGFIDILSDINDKTKMIYNCNKII
jgi:GNAT superfamily N-acetyltransferase